MSSDLDKLRSLDEVRAQFMAKAHRTLDLMFLASSEQLSESFTGLEEELDTYLEIVWRKDGKKAQIMKTMEIPDVIPDWLT